MPARGRSYEEHSVGRLYRTAIECRHIKRRITKNQVAAFHDLIDDIGGTTAVIVTTAGFQVGAARYAKYRGVRLVLVNPMLRRFAFKSSRTPLGFAISNPCSTRYSSMR